MLIGQFEGRISEKFQVAFPKKFREAMGKTLVITKGFEQCLIVVSVEKWEVLLEGIEQPFIKQDVRELRRFLLGNALEITLDKKGRFIVPEYLRSYGKTREDVIFAGVGNFIEIWEKSVWTKHQLELSGKITSVAERLGTEERA